MATSAQITANRLNAQKSTGPRGGEGKSRSRLNSLRHGLRAESAVLPGEDPQVLAEIRDAFYEEHQPAGPDQIFCVEKMISAFWRNRRVAPAEARVAAEIGFARSFALPADTLNRIARYEGALDRAFYRALNELRRLRRERGEPAQLAATDSAATAAAPAPASPPASPPPALEPAENTPGSRKLASLGRMPDPAAGAPPPVRKRTPPANIRLVRPAPAPTGSDNPALRL